MTLTRLKTTQEVLSYSIFLNKNNSTEHLKAATLYPQLSSLLKDVSVQPLDKTKVYAFLRDWQIGPLKFSLCKPVSLRIMCIYIKQDTHSASQMSINSVPLQDCYKWLTSRITYLKVHLGNCTRTKVKKKKKGGKFRTKQKPT